MDALEELLQNWDLLQIYPILKDAGIKREHVPFLSDSDLKRLFPERQSLGLKGRFRRKINSLSSERDSIQKVQEWLEKLNISK